MNEYSSSYFNSLLSPHIYDIPGIKPTFTIQFYKLQDSLFLKLPELITLITLAVINFTVYKVHRLCKKPAEVNMCQRFSPLFSAELVATRSGLFQPQGIKFK